MIRSNPNATGTDSVLKQRELFQSLSDPAAPKGALGASVGIHAALLTLLIVIPLLMPQALRVNYTTMLLAPPPPEPKHVEPVLIKLPPPPKLVAPKREIKAEAPIVPAPPPVVRQPEVRPVAAVPIVPKPAAPPVAPVAPTVLDPKPGPGVAPPAPPVVVTNVFSGVSQPAIAAAPARTTEAAGFGPLNANRDVNRSTKSDVTSSAGFGEVSGTAREGVRGGRTDASVGGFGDAVGSKDRGKPGRTGSVGSVGGFDVAAAGPVRSANDRGVAASGFGAPAEAPRAAAVPKAAEGPIEKPVEVVTKPRPDYTDEARKAKIEGEVLLRVLFTATGEARVQQVVQGLGYGLNENAIRAAEQIRFKPAQRAGQPVDSTAVVHIVFQLAY